MKILVALNHPAHYYLFKYIALILINKGYKVKYVIKDKDILEKLLISEKIGYIKINEKRKRKPNKFSVITNKIIEVIAQDVNLYKLIKGWKPDLMMGTDIAITHIGQFFKIPSFVFNEDDYEINKLFCLSAYPFATNIISPDICSVGRYKEKKIGYNGFQKMAYLNPNYFQSNYNQIKDLIGANEKYFVIRLVSLTAGHDVEGKHSGLNESVIDNIIEYLSGKGKIFITSEDNLTSKYEKFRLKMELNKMHDLLAFASVFIGDSQTMCAEAGLLGTPFIRFNDFVGKISYLNEIENKYKLGFGIPTSDPSSVLIKLQEILEKPDIKIEWKKRKEAIFRDKIDINAFIVWLVDQYPQSIQIIKENPAYQDRFK